MARKTDPTDRVIDAAMAVAAEQGWARTSITDIAAKAGLSLADLRLRFDSKGAILRAFLRRIDAQVLAGVGPPDGTESARDRLFDLMMVRFEALRPYRAAIAVILREAPADPVGAACFLPDYLGSMGWMLEGAGISSAGVGGTLRANGLAAINLAVSQVWLTDDSADLAKTMASLDQWLARAEWLERATGAGRRGRRPQPADAKKTDTGEAVGALAEDLS